MSGSHSGFMSFHSVGGMEGYGLSLYSVFREILTLWMMISSRVVFRVFDSYQKIILWRFLQFEEEIRTIVFSFWRKKIWKGIIFLGRKKGEHYFLNHMNNFNQIISNKIYCISTFFMYFQLRDIKMKLIYYFEIHMIIQFIFFSNYWSRFKDTKKSWSNFHSDK